LNRRGFRTRNHKPFTGSYVAKLLHNPIYKGLMIYGRQRPVKRNGAKKVEYCKDFAVYPGAFEPLVPEELYSKSLSNLEKRKHNRGISDAVPNVLGGLVFCGDCGETMVRGIDKHGKGFFVCGRYKRTGACSHHYVAEARIIGGVKRAAGSVNWEVSLEDIREKMLQNRTKQLQALDSEMQGLERQLDGCAHRRDMLFELVESGRITGEEFGSRKQRLDERQKELEQLRAVLKDRYKELCGMPPPDGDPPGEAEWFESCLVSLCPEDRKVILRQMVERVEVMGNERPYGRKQINIFFRL